MRRQSDMKSRVIGSGTHLLTAATPPYDAVIFDARHSSGPAGGSARRLHMMPGGTVRQARSRLTRKPTHDEGSKP